MLDKQDQGSHGVVVDEATDYAVRGPWLLEESRRLAKIVQTQGNDEVQNMLPECELVAGEAVAFINAQSLHEPTEPVSAGMQAHCGEYFRAFFHFTTEPGLRAVLIKAGALAALSKWATTCEREVVLTASLANLLHEETPKRAFVKEHDGAAVMRKLLLGHQNSTILMHATRALFSLTTVYELKPLFANETAILQHTIARITIGDAALTMNAVGAIANIAIHPASKARLAQMNLLPNLKAVGEVSDSELVLHQVTRCMFSMAALKEAREPMCDMGFLDVIERCLQVGLGNNDILINATGCYGNLSLTDERAKDSNIVEFVHALYETNDNPGFIRQAARVLNSLCVKERVRKRLSTERFVERTMAKLRALMAISPVAMSADAYKCDVLDSARDMLSALSAVLQGNPKLKEAALANGIDSTLFEAWEHFKASSETACNVVGGIAALCESQEMRVRLAANHVWRLKRICESAGAKNASPRMKKLCMGIMGWFAETPSLRAAVVSFGGLETAMDALFLEKTNCTRRLAGKTVGALAGNGAAPLVKDLVQYGGVPMGESLRLHQNTLQWICTNNDPSEVSVPSAGFVARVFPCAEGAVEIRTFEPLVRARFPVWMETLDIADKAAFSHVPRAAWILFNKHIHTNASDVESGAERDGSEPDVAVLLVALRKAYSESKRLPLCGEDVGARADDFDKRLSAAPWEGAAAKMINNSVDVVLRASKSSQCEIVFPVSKRRDDSFVCAYSKNVAKELLLSSMPGRASGAATNVGDVDMGLDASSANCEPPVVSNEEEEDARVSGQRKRVAFAEVYKEAAPAAEEAPMEGSAFVGVHKSILVARSEHFQNMFLQPWAESNDAAIDFEFPQEIMAVVVRYLYCGLDHKMETAISEDKNLAWNVLRAAHKYNIEGLLHYCEYSVGSFVKKNPEAVVRAIAGAGTFHLPCVWAMIFSQYESTREADPATHKKLQKAFAKHPAILDILKEAGLHIEAASE